MQVTWKQGRDGGTQDREGRAEDNCHPERVSTLGSMFNSLGISGDSSAHTICSLRDEASGCLYTGPCLSWSWAEGGSQRGL